MRSWTASLGLVASLWASAAFAQSTDPLQRSVEAIAESFERSYRDCGLTPAFSPGVEIRTHPSLISYSTAGRKVVISRYDDLPSGLKTQLAAWAGPLDLPDGPTVFEAIFQRLGTAHEMGHWQQHLSRRFFTLDRWESEVEANRIAIAFWSERPQAAPDLAATVEGWLGVMGALPDPVPEGEDPRVFLQANYREIVVDPAKYGWFQGEFLREAWARRDEADFCALARLNASAPIEAFAED
ncbi:hypothetical protein [Brevundimonas sp.]|uniref:hypothetical protein n=1 Tax=Brevundimonas sp. TaxID=1871086 RepID=UPI0035B49CE3